MYESHFGLDGLPFETDSDPRFFFDSKRHHAALGELRAGVAEGKRFLVLQGEPGSGKSMLLRTLLAELRATQVEVGLVIGRPHPAPVWAAAVATALGVPAEAQAAGPSAALPRHLANLAMEGRRPVLLVDDAHQLGREALEMLVELQRGGPLGLGSITVCLAGRAALAVALEGPELASVRERVDVTCALGPLEAAETAAYIEHRLTVVGWKRLPRFDTEALDEIHRHSGGNPLHINALGHEVVLSRYLSSQVHVDVTAVDDAVQTLRDAKATAAAAESTASPAATPADAPAAYSPRTAPAPQHAPVPAQEPTRSELVADIPIEPITPLAAAAAAAAARDAARRRAMPHHPQISIGELPVLTQAVRSARNAPAPEAPAASDTQPVVPPIAQRGGGRPLLCVVGGQADHIKAAALWRALAGRTDLPVMLMVRAYANNAYARHSALFAGLDVAGRLVNLGIGGAASAARAAELTQRFEFVLDQCQPGAVIVFDGSDAALSCGLVAQRKSIPVVQMGAGLRGPGQQGAADLTRKLTDELSDVLYTADPQAGDRLSREGILLDRISFAGNLLIDSLQHVLRDAPAEGTPPELASVPPALLADRNGYAVVVLHSQANLADRTTLTDLITMLRGISHDMPLIWPMHSRAREQLAKFRLDATLAGERIVCLPSMAYAPYAHLLSHATCVITDSWNVQEEATALGIPCISVGLESECPITSAVGSNTHVGMSKAQATRAVWHCIFNGGKRGEVPELWDGQTGPRIAEHLSLWLREVTTVKTALGAYASAG